MVVMFIVHSHHCLPFFYFTFILIAVLTIQVFAFTKDSWFRRSRGILHHNDIKNGYHFPWRLNSAEIEVDSFNDEIIDKGKIVYSSNIDYYDVLDDKDETLDNINDKTADLLQFMDDDMVSSYQKGSSKDSRIVQQYAVPSEGFAALCELPASDLPIDVSNVLRRVPMTADNVTLPVALMLLDSEEYPTLTRARRTIRKGSILVQKLHL